jgi:acyl carrier protein
MVKPAPHANVDEKTLVDVRDLIAHQCGISPRDIQRDSTLVGDLGISGADGVELMIAFSRQFGVDISRMNLGQYFGDEGLSLAFWRWGAPLIPISVADLVGAVHAKRWDMAAPTI